jgi:hypothetical protein
MVPKPANGLGGSMKLPKSVHDDLNTFHHKFLNLIKNKSFESKP